MTPLVRRPDSLDVLGDLCKVLGMMLLVLGIVLSMQGEMPVVLAVLDGVLLVLDGMLLLMFTVGGRRSDRRAIDTGGMVALQYASGLITAAFASFIVMIV